MRRLVIDTNLLLLLIVGASSIGQIAKHRRLRSVYSAEDFHRLISFAGDFDKIVTVPNALAEISNLLSDGDDSDSRSIKERFAALVHDSIEVYKPSAVSVEQPEFWWLGLNDTAQLLAAGDDHTLLTADGPLHDAALRRGVTAIHFSSLPG